MAGTIIYYFSGTGNSLYVARELKRRLPEARLQSILSVIKMKRLPWMQIQLAWSFLCI